MDEFEPDMDRIRECTGVDTIHFKLVVESTNDWAIEAGRVGEVSLPALFLTSEQTHGRGRGDKRWSSPKGSLTFSLLVRRPVPVESAHAGLVALIAADAICEAIKEVCGLQSAIKWPNDVYLNDRKLAGILIESVGTTMLVIGCGLNVSNPTDDLPHATNLSNALSSRPSIEAILIGIVQRMNEGVSGLERELSPDVTNSSERNGLTGKMLDRCRSRDWLLGRLIKHSSSNETLSGTSLGFSDDGGLVMEFEGKERRIVRTGSISVL